MGERRKDALRVDFGASFKLRFHGVNITSDAGLLTYRELDDALRSTTMAEQILEDRLTGKSTQHSLTALLRRRLWS